MKTWDLVRCSDHYFRRAIYGLGPHIADYPEQSVAAGVVYGWCFTSVHSTAVKILGRHLHADQRPSRCNTHHKHLDNPAAELRTREQLLMLLSTEDNDTLWFDHGIVPDFLVGFPPLPPSVFDQKLMVDSSHSRPTSHEPIFTNFLLRTFSTKPSRGHSKITSLPGSKNFLNSSTAPQRVHNFLMRLIGGMLFHSFFDHFSPRAPQGCPSTAIPWSPSV
jgi:hypothetical protein